MLIWWKSSCEFAFVLARIFSRYSVAEQRRRDLTTGGEAHDE